MLTILDYIYLHYIVWKKNNPQGTNRGHGNIKKRSNILRACVSPNYSSRQQTAANRSLTDPSSRAASRAINLRFCSRAAANCEAARWTMRWDDSVPRLHFPATSARDARLSPNALHRSCETTGSLARPRLHGCSQLPPSAEEPSVCPLSLWHNYTGRR